MRILIIGDPNGRDDEGMKRVNNHLKNALVALGHECAINRGLTLRLNLVSWNKIVFTGGPSKNTLYKIAIMRILNRKSEFIVCGLMPSIPSKWSNIFARCVDKVVSENPHMVALADLNQIPVVRHTASTFSFEHFLRGRVRQKPRQANGPLRILHVGHLNEKRNVFELANLCKKLNCPITFLVSSSEKEEKKERQRLEAVGAKIISDYQDDLFGFYRQFDLYAFPVERPDAAISMPLSIIEALLSGLNVISTDFGEVSTYFGNSKSVEIVKSLDDLTISQLEDLAARPMMSMAKLRQFDTKHFAQVVAGAS